MRDVTEGRTDRSRWEGFWGKTRVRENTRVFEVLIACFRFLANLVRSQLASHHIKKGELRILEVGCGTAVSSILLARRKKLREIIGVDFSRSAVSIARKNSCRYHVNASFVLADARFLPFRKDTFGLTWNMGLLEHFKEPRPAVSEMVRVTRNEGVILVFIPSHNNILVRVRDIVRKVTGIYFDFNKTWGDSRAYRMDLYRIFSEANLVDIKIQAVSQELLIETMAIGQKRV